MHHRKLDLKCKQRKKVRRELWHKQDGQCFWCKCDLVPPPEGRLPKNAATIDHVVPLSRHRLRVVANAPSNLVLACWGCNQARNRADALSERVSGGYEAEVAVVTQTPRENVALSLSLVALVGAPR